MAGLLVLCLIGAAALTLLARKPVVSTAPTEQIALVIQRIPLEAQNALRGEDRIFDALTKSAAQLKTLRASAGDAAKGDAATWKKLDDDLATVGGARQAVGTIPAANQEARELAPQTLTQLGELGSSVGGQKLEGMSRYLDRFELMVQRIQQDLNRF